MSAHSTNDVPTISNHNFYKCVVPTSKKILENYEVAKCYDISRKEPLPTSYFAVLLRNGLQVRRRCKVMKVELYLFVCGSILQIYHENLKIGKAAVPGVCGSMVIKIELAIEYGKRVDLQTSQKRFFIGKPIILL